MAESDKYENVLSMGYRLQGGKHEYVIEDILGRGGFGITYKVKARVHVENIVIDAHFAVKEYFPDLDKHTGFLNIDHSWAKEALRRYKNAE